MAMRRFIMFAVLASAGCEDSRPEPGFIPIDELRAAYRDAWCTYLVRCGELPDLATCAHAALHYWFPVSTQGVLAGRAKFDAAAAEQCFSQISTATCDRTDDDLRSTGNRSDSLPTAYPAVCNAIVRGLVKDGGLCSVSDECISGTCDRSSADCSSGCCIGRCASGRAPVPVGSACERGVDTCVDGVCTYPESSVVPMCAPHVRRGEVCRAGTWNECEPGLGCVTANGATTCEPLPTIGQLCPDGLCRDDGTTCGPAGTCVAVGLPGAACVTNSDCSDYYGCDDTGHCAPVEEFDACANTVHNSCFEAGQFCSNLRCARSVPAGGDCSGITGRRLGVCAGGGCWPDPRYPDDYRRGICGEISPAACY